MNKFTRFFLIFIIYYNVYAAAGISSFNPSNSPIKCHPQLQKYLSQIEKISEARLLITSIQKEGPIQITINNRSTNKFGAYWDPDNRLIGVTCLSDSDEGRIIGALLFELHNASVNRDFKYLENLAIKKKISKAFYVKSMEYLEYKNSLNSAKLAEIGIKAGIFPKNARLPTYANFDEHFYEQRKSGHSDWFARLYDSLTHGWS